MDSLPLAQHAQMIDSPHPETILTLAANVSEADAFRKFQDSTISSIIWRFVNGPLQRMAQVYLPFALYRLQYQLGRTLHTRFFALDQVEGALDLYEFPDLIAEKDLFRIETPNSLRPILSADRSQSFLRDKALRVIFQHGFFRIRQPQLQIALVRSQFHIPYWLGIFGKDGHLRCRTIDAVRGRIEGQKVTRLFETWLAN